MRFYGFMRLGRRFGIGTSIGRTQRTSAYQFGMHIATAFWILFILMCIILLIIF